MGRRERAEAVKAATDRQNGSTPPRHSGRRLVVDRAPELIRDATGEPVGVDVWVRLLDADGVEVPVDPHRRIINPPTVPRANVRHEDRPIRGRDGETERVRLVGEPDPGAAFWEAVWDSVESHPNPSGRGTVTTVFSDVTPVYQITSTSATYSAARAGSDLGTSGLSTFAVGQNLFGSDFLCFEGLVSFDTSSIDDGQVITEVTLDLFLGFDFTGGSDFVVEAREHSGWTLPPDTGDWVAGADLGSLTLMASVDTDGIGSGGAYKTLTSENAFVTAANLKTGTVFLVINSARHRIGAAPSGQEFVRFSSASSSGTSEDPKLTITHDTPPTADAGVDQSVDEGATVNLEGTGSSDPEDAPTGDPTGALLSYAWTVQNADGTGLTTGDLTGATTATPSFTAPEVSGPDAQIVIQLEVTDSAGGTDTDTVTITVSDTTLVEKTGAGGLVLGGQAEVEFQSFMLLRHTAQGGLALGGAADSTFSSFVRVRHTGTGGIAVSGSARAHKTHHVEHFLPSTLSGDHSIIGEARVVTGFQSGHDPEGTKLTISGGDITYAGTAKIFATLSLDLPGVDDNDRGLFPVHPSDLLAPYGNEVFVRIGIHLGSHIQWFPMGYFRINTDEQDEAAYGPIGISLQDRMAGIIEARLLRPKAYPLGTLVGSAVDDLVKEVYPDAQIEFDDDSDEAALGRQFIVEKDRYGGLKDIADHLGKIVFWNDEGVLRFQDQPAPGEIAFAVNAGQDGVLVEAGRRVTREGVYNAVVARGEGADTNEPVEGIAVDGNVDSPTYFFGVNSSGKVFGKVPRFYSSPLLTTNGQCEQAATTILRRLLGTPYSVDFGSVINPSLRPYQNVRIRQSDGSTENHIIDRLSIPLTAGRNMSGKTREQTLQQVVIV